MYNIQIEDWDVTNLPLLKMNLALEIWVGQQKGLGSLYEGLPLTPRWLPPRYDGSTELCKT